MQKLYHQNGKSHCYFTILPSVQRNHYAHAKTVIYKLCASKWKFGYIRFTIGHWQLYQSVFTIPGTIAHYSYLLTHPRDQMIKAVNLTLPQINAGWQRYPFLDILTFLSTYSSETHPRGLQILGG